MEDGVLIRKEDGGPPLYGGLAASPSDYFLSCLPSRTRTFVCYCVLVNCVFDCVICELSYLCLGVDGGHNGADANHTLVSYALPLLGC